MKREPQAGCDNARPAGSRQTLFPTWPLLSQRSDIQRAAATGAELRFSLSLNGSALRSSCRPHRAAGVWTCCHPAPDCPHRRRPGGSRVHGKVGCAGYFWIRVCQRVKLSGRCNQSSAVRGPQNGVTHSNLWHQSRGEECVT